MKTKTPEKKEAAARTTAPVIEQRNKSYRDHAPKSMKNLREQKIAERREAMPRAYQANYDKAVSGRSRKAAMRAFCCECCGWEIREVFACTDLSCVMWPYRPRSRVPQVASESVRKPPESKKSSTGGHWAGV